MQSHLWLLHLGRRCAGQLNCLNFMHGNTLHGGIGTPFDNTKGSFPKLCALTNTSSAKTIKRRTLLNSRGLLENFTGIKQPECGTFNHEGDWFLQQQLA